MRLNRFLSILCLGGSLAIPSFAQFAIAVEVNGQASAIANGAAITVNAPAVGQTALATVTLTYGGTTKATFTGKPQILGSTAFSVDPVTVPVSLSILGSTTFTIRYTPSDATQVLSQLTWAFSQDAATAGGSPTTGILIFNLAGNAPKLTVSAIQVDNNYVIVPNGGSFQFADTVSNSTSSTTIAISNPGSGPGKINSISLSGDGFQLSGVPLLPLTLNAGAELRFTAQFKPTAAGIRRGALQIGFENGNYTASVSANAISGYFTYQITQDGKTSATEAGQAITFSDTKVGEKNSITIQFRNVATSAIALNTIAITGSQFSIVDGPFLPATLLPQESNTVTIAYAPAAPGSSTGRLLIGNDTFALSGRGLGPLLQLSYQVNGSTVTPGSTDAVTFPPAAVGETASLQFAITNKGTTAASLVSIAVQDTKGIFRLRDLPGLPVQIEPNASVAFGVNFTPQAAGQASTSLIINNQAITLVGFANAASLSPLPTYRFTGASGTQQPFQQPSIGLTLDSPYSSAVTGTLTLSVASSSFAGDPAVQFSTGGRQVAFTIPANTLQAVFPSGSQQIQLQTGTVAGTIVVTPSFASGGTDLTPANPGTLQITVPSVAPALLTASIGSRTSTSFSVLITGFSSLRSLDRLDFQLTGGSGFTLATTTLTVDVSGAAKVWFLSDSAQQVGGQFNVEIPFTLSSGSSSSSSTVDLLKSISSISVAASNAAGKSNAIAVQMP